jgi:hypothetical protein
LIPRRCSRMASAKSSCARSPMLCTPPSCSQPLLRFLVRLCTCVSVCVSLCQYLRMVHVYLVLQLQQTCPSVRII